PERRDAQLELVTALLGTRIRERLQERVVTSARPKAQIAACTAKARSKPFGRRSIMSHTSTAASASRRNGRHETCRPGREERPTSRLPVPQGAFSLSHCSRPE